VYERRLRHDPAPWIAALIATTAGLINLASIVWPSFDDSSPLQTLLPGLGHFASRPAAVAVNAAVGAALLVLAGGLRRSVRWAWWATVALLGAGLVVHLAVRGEVIEAVLEAVFLGWLIGKSASFHARRGPGDRRRIVVPLMELVGLTAAYGLVGLLVNGADFVTDRGLFGSLYEVSRMAVGLGTTTPLPGVFGRVFPGSVAALFVTGVAFIVVRAITPQRVVSAAPPSAQELEASEDSLAYFATRDDRVTVRVRDGLVSYGVAGSVALAAGDPLGPTEAWPAAVDAFLAQAAETGRVPAVLGCAEDAAALYRSAGMRRVYLGDEAIVELDTFDIDTPARKGAREGWRRGIREGMTATVIRSGDLSEAETQELRLVSEQWLGAERERGFSMALSRLFDDRDDSTRFLVARDVTGRALAFIHIVPWATDGAGIDVMRRAPDAPAYINDYLVVEAARMLPATGIRRLSLNFAFLRGLIEASAREDAPAITRWQGRVLARLSGPFQIESLYRFNAKFDPLWHRRYACVQSITDVPRVALAMGRAEGQFRAPWDRWHRHDAVLPPQRLPEPEIELEPAPIAVQPAPASAEPTTCHRFEELRAAGCTEQAPSPTHGLETVRSMASLLPQGAEGDTRVAVQGVMTDRRVLGSLVFLVIQDGGGATLQMICERDRMGDRAFQHALLLRPGDPVACAGVPARSRRGEPSIQATLIVPAPAGDPAWSRSA
jgi:lysyl-tRNA synthetase, class II